MKGRPRRSTLAPKPTGDKEPFLFRTGKTGEDSRGHSLADGSGDGPTALAASCRAPFASARSILGAAEGRSAPGQIRIELQGEAAGGQPRLARFPALAGSQPRRHWESERQHALEPPPPEGPAEGRGRRRPAGSSCRRIMLLPGTTPVPHHRLGSWGPTGAAPAEAERRASTRTAAAGPHRL